MHMKVGSIVLNVVLLGIECQSCHTFNSCEGNSSKWLSNQIPFNGFTAEISELSKLYLCFIQVQKWLNVFYYS